MFMIMPIYIPVSDSDEQLPPPFQQKFGKINALLVPLVLIAAVFLALHLHTAHTEAFVYELKSWNPSSREPLSALATLMTGHMWEVAAGLVLVLFGPFFLIGALMYERRFWVPLAALAFVALAVTVVVLANTPAG